MRKNGKKLAPTDLRIRGVTVAVARRALRRMVVESAVVYPDGNVVVTGQLWLPPGTYRIT